MTFNLLLDLDDTLLDTNLEAFLAAYFKKLAVTTSDQIPPDKFIKAMLQSTQIMYDNKNTSRTLEEVFDENFYPAIGIGKDTLARSIEKFYDEIFPTLGDLTKPRPEAVRLVEWAFEQGWKVSIATDPLFPRKAILHRLRWAGLAPENYPFTLISDFHNFHFAKKSVAYYPEFLDSLGWANEPVLMVGDSLERDILPAQSAGVPVFWLHADGSSMNNGIPQGWYSDLKNYLEAVDLPALNVKYDTPSSIIAFLMATPAMIHNFAKKIPTIEWNKCPADGEWSFLETICHLRDVDAFVNLPRVHKMINGENIRIAGQETDQWVHERKYNQQDPDKAFIDFVQYREDLIELLRGLSYEDWNRQARHTILGTTLLSELVGFMIDHDQLHIRQASTLVKAS